MGDDTSIKYFGSSTNTRQYRNVMNFVPHPEFIPETMEHDIAVIRVSMTLELRLFPISGSIVNDQALFFLNQKHVFSA